MYSSTNFLSLFTNRKDNKVLESRLLFFKKNQGCAIKTLQILGMRNLLDTLQTSNRSFTSGFSLFMTIPLIKNFC